MDIADASIGAPVVPRPDGFSVEGCVPDGIVFRHAAAVVFFLQNQPKLAHALSRGEALQIRVT